MKKIKALNGYTIYQYTSRDEKNGDGVNGHYAIYFSSDVREYGRELSEKEFNDVETLNEAIELCNDGGYAITREELEKEYTAVSHADIEKETKKNQLKVTRKHNGKMEGMQSLSTSCALNELCMKCSKHKDKVCSKCYSQAMHKRYTNLAKMLEVNHHILTERRLTKDEIKALNINSLYFRFEAFGELNNVIQLANYIDICNSYPNTQFTLWTKHEKVLNDGFNTINNLKKPKNLRIGLSGFFLDDETHTSPIIKAIRTYIDFYFNVYTLDYLKNKFNGDLKAIDNFINCGGKKCLDCLKCYKPNKKTMIINEMLKSDFKKFEKELKTCKQ